MSPVLVSTMQFIAFGFAVVAFTIVLRWVFARTDAHLRRIGSRCSPSSRPDEVDARARKMLADIDVKKLSRQIGART